MKQKEKNGKRSDNSDVNAKTWYEEKLVRDGYTIVANEPVDIVAEKNGVSFFLKLNLRTKPEVKMSMMEW